MMEGKPITVTSTPTDMGVTEMTDRTRVEHFGRITEQASRLQSDAPELFDYLRQRDDLLRRILLRVPDPADPEGSANFDFHSRVWQPLRRIPPGLSDLT